MAHSTMTCLGIRRQILLLCAGAAVCLAALAGGCGSPAESPAKKAADAAPRESAAELKASTAARAPDATEASTAPGAGGATTASATSAGATLRGRVILQGAAPARRVINTSKDAVCAQLHDNKPVLDEDLLVGEGGGVKNAFVYVRRGAPKQDYPQPQQPAVLDQKGCMFAPRVQGIRVGQKLMVGNGDPVTHNVRSFPIVNPAFNFGQPPETGARERVFTKAEREIEVQCDIHPWMHAYIFVMDHPFYCVSGDDGSYTIAGLPPGEYTLECWHEKLGKQRQTVTVADSPPAEVGFTYAAP